MRRGMMSGLIAGMLIGGTAAMAYGVMNWKQERALCKRAERTGRWVIKKADHLFH